MDSSDSRLRFLEFQTTCPQWLEVSLIVANDAPFTGLIVRVKVFKRPRKNVKWEKIEESRLKWRQAETEISHIITPQKGRFEKFHVKPSLWLSDGRIERLSQRPRGTHCELGTYLSNGRKSIVIKEVEELFVESEEMKICPQTGPIFPEFDRPHHPNVVNGHHFLTSIFLPIPITHIVQFEL
jgi:hypothetical protein